MFCFPLAVYFWSSRVGILPNNESFIGLQHEATKLTALALKRKYVINQIDKKKNTNYNVHNLIKENRNKQ